MVLDGLRREPRSDKRVLPADDVPVGDPGRILVPEARGELSDNVSPGVLGLLSKAPLGGPRLEDPRHRHALESLRLTVSATPLGYGLQMSVGAVVALGAVD